MLPLVHLLAEDGNGLHARERHGERALGGEVGFRHEAPVDLALRRDGPEARQDLAGGDPADGLDRARGELDAHQARFGRVIVAVDGGGWGHGGDAGAGAAVC